MTFDLFSFIFSLSLGFISTLSLARRNAELIIGLTLTVLLTLLCSFVSPAFLTLMGIIVVGFAWKTNKNLGKKKHLNWVKLDRSNMVVVREKIQEGLVEGRAAAGPIIIESEDSPEDFREKALTQNPFRQTNHKFD